MPAKAHNSLPIVAILGWLALVVLALAPSAAQEPATDPEQDVAIVEGAARAAPRPLRLAYVLDGGEATERIMRELAATLWADEILRPCLEGEGFVGIVATGVPSAASMADALASGVYDVVFAPLNSLRGQQAARYRVVLQVRRPMDAWDPQGRIGAQQQSVIVALPGARPDFAAGSWALVGGDSVSGSMYPRLFLLDSGHGSPTETHYRPTSEEVFRAVSNGLVQFGAMDRAAFEEQLRAHEAQAREVRLQYPGLEPVAPEIVAITQPYPAPPVLISRGLLPPRREIGRELRAAMIRWSEGQGTAAPFTLVAADEAWYRSVPEDVQRYYDLIAEATP